MAQLAPITAALGPLGTAVSVLGTAFSAYSSFQSSRYQEAILRRNAAVADLNAKNEINRAQVEGQDRDFAALMEISRMEARQTASGFAATSGSFRAANADLRTLARRDTLRLRNQAETTAQAFRTEASGLRAQASMERSSRFFGLVSSALDVGSTLVTGAAKVNNTRAREIRRDSIGGVS